jgi:hypothetical protein
MQVLNYGWTEKKTAFSQTLKSLRNLHFVEGHTVLQTLNPWVILVKEIVEVDQFCLSYLFFASNVVL